jgi:hypothetical protein
MARNFAHFDDLPAADVFAQEREAEGFESVSILSNLPEPGRFEVRWSNLDWDNSFESLARSYKKILDERRAAADEKFDAGCRCLGRQLAAEEFAESEGLSGRDREVFVQGFSGWNAKVANPRADGREHIFRAGRAAWGSREGQRAFRRCSVAARTIVHREKPAPFSEGGAIANGEY